MPELPEVETVRRGLAPVLQGHRLSRVITRRTDLRWPLPDGFGQRLTNRQVTAVARRAKFLTIRLDNDMIWIAHLGMSGRFRIFEGDLPPEEPTTMSSSKPMAASPYATTTPAGLVSWT